MLALPEKIFTRVLLSFAVLSYMSVIVGFAITNHSIAEEAPMNRQQQCAEYGVYQDTSGNWLDCESTQVEENYEDGYVEDSYVEDGYVEDGYAEETYAEEPYQEEIYKDESYRPEADTDDSYSD